MACLANASPDLDPPNHNYLLLHDLHHGHPTLTVDRTRAPDLSPGPSTACNARRLGKNLKPQALFQEWADVVGILYTFCRQLPQCAAQLL